MNRLVIYDVIVSLTILLQTLVMSNALVAHETSLFVKLLMMFLTNMDTLALIIFQTLRGPSGGSSRRPTVDSCRVPV